MAFPACLLAHDPDPHLMERALLSGPFPAPCPATAPVAPASAGLQGSSEAAASAPPRGSLCGHWCHPHQDRTRSTEGTNRGRGPSPSIGVKAGPHSGSSALLCGTQGSRLCRGHHQRHTLVSFFKWERLLEALVLLSVCPDGLFQWHPGHGRHAPGIMTRQSQEYSGDSGHFLLHFNYQVG